MITKLHNKEFTAHTNRPFSFLAMITLKAKSMQNSESKQFITGNSQNRKTLHSSNNEFGFDFTLLKPWGLDVGNFAISKGQTQTLYWGPPQWAKQPVKDLTFFHQDDLRGFFLFFFFLVPGLSLSWIWSLKFELFSKMMKKEIDLYDYFRQTYLFQSVSKETELPTLLLVPLGHEFLLRLLSKFCRPETFLPKLALRK